MLYTTDASLDESDALEFIPAISEFRRVLKPGGLCLVTVPFGRSGVHGWYQVFNENQEIMVVDAFQPTEYAIDYFGYRPNGWYRARPEELAEADLFDVHQAKPLAQDFAGAAYGAACLRMIA